MSHNVELEGVEFSDPDILEKAVKELKAEGVADIEFKRPVEGQKVTIRGWRGSAGEGIRYNVAAWDKPLDYECDAAIVFKEGKYDIGFNKKVNANGDTVYVPYIENSWNCPLRAEAGAETVKGDHIATTTSHAMSGSGCNSQVGRLTQRYAILKAEHNARKAGIQTRRVKGAKGVIQLIARR